MSIPFPFRGEITFAGRRGEGRERKEGKKKEEEKKKKKNPIGQRKSGKVPRCQCSEQAEWLIDLTRERKRRKRNRRKARGEEGTGGRGERVRWEGRGEGAGGGEGEHGAVGEGVASGGSLGVEVCGWLG